MFIDKAKIWIKSGKGGDGKVSFHREKYVSAGGPDGGDGGRGASVIFVVDDNLSTLLDFRYKRKYVAQDGENGGSAKCFGKDATDLVIKVPRGTLIREAVSGAVVKDMSDKEPYTLLKGGKGGWGNQHFATPTRQTPRFAKAGLPGQEMEVILELKLLADVGLVGFPNVGKSTLLSMISAAQPKIANYHFTTLSPNLGVVNPYEGSSFVVADIPGIIEGAADGAGLGHDFLRHIDRCRLLIHVIDASGIEGRDPLNDYEIINEELKGYSDVLAARPQIIALNKTDIIEDLDALQALKDHFTQKGHIVLTMSAATNQGVKELVAKTWEELVKLPPVVIFESDYVAPDVSFSAADVTIELVDGVFVVEGVWIERLMGNVNLDDYESRMYFERMLRKEGIFARIEAMGVVEGQTVSIYDFEFEYVF